MPIEAVMSCRSPADGEDSEANDTIVGTSEALDVDAALPRLLNRYLDQAIADGYGEQEIPAISELMARGDT